ncbi:MAG: hypothetical protein ACREQ5_30530, partial [Candidatus Dormibacteria bacterium]
MKNAQRISVTAENIEAGRAGDRYRCPIARAISNTFLTSNVEVFTHDVAWWDPLRGRCFRARLS